MEKLVENWTPKVGDGFLVLKTKDRHIVGNVSGTFKDILVYSKSGQKFKLDDIRQETLMEHFTRPTGFGGTPWPQFIFFLCIFMYGVYASISTWNDSGWIGIVLLSIVLSVYLLWTTLKYYRIVNS